MCQFEDIDYNKINLNKLNTDDLNKHKANMELKYQANAILPGSENFVYDVEKEFDCDEYDNEWDESMT